MPVNEKSRFFHLRFLRGGYTSEPGAYGTDTYGSADQTYGQRTGESVVTGTEYMIVPDPGARPAVPAWVFRTNDTGKPFIAAIVNQVDPSDRLDLEPVVEAELVLTEFVTFGASGSMIARRTFPLVWDPIADVLRRDWDPGDLVRPGRYIVNIRLLFESGRYMTLEGNDDSYAEVVDAPSLGSTPGGEAGALIWD